jgi:pimeloyl-ACP methyl ester carboxylesterase
VPVSDSRSGSAFDNSRVTLDSGRSLSFHGEGSIVPPILLLHGLNGHSGTWRKNIPTLSQERRVIAPSLPPWQGSTESDDISAYVRMVVSLIEKLGLSKLSIVGNSMGGWIAMKIAQLQPHLVESLVLEDSAGVSNDSDAMKDIDSAGIPVLVIWGELDRIIPADAARYLHSRIKNSNLEIFDNTGHVPHWENPDSFNNSLLRFLREKS